MGTKRGVFDVSGYICVKKSIGSVRRKPGDVRGRETGGGAAPILFFLQSWWPDEPLLFAKCLMWFDVCSGVAGLDKNRVRGVRMNTFLCHVESVVWHGMGERERERKRSRKKELDGERARESGPARI